YLDMKAVRRLQDRFALLRTWRRAGARRVGNGMLHPRIGHDDEEARQPRSEEHGDAHPPVSPAPEAALAEQEQTQECRLQEKREYAFHDERLADDAARRPRERRPVRAELEFHRDAGHDAER